VIEQRLRDVAASWFPPTPSLADDVRRRLSETPDAVRSRRLPRRSVVVALALLALTGTAIAASWLDLVPGVRVQHVDQLPELGFATPPFGEETTLDEVRDTLPFQVVLPRSLDEPDTLLLDRDRAGAPVLTAVYGGPGSARLLITQWPATVILFDKLLDHYTRSEYVDVRGAPGIWIDGGDHAVFYLGRTAQEDRVGGYLTGNVLVWQRGRISYRLELGGTLEDALHLAGSLRPPA